MNPILALLALAAFLAVSEMDYRDYVLVHVQPTLARSTP